MATTRIVIDVSNKIHDKSNSSGQQHNNERQQLKVFVLMVASLFVLLGTMNYQRDIQTMIVSSSGQMSWDTGNGGSSSFNASKSSSSSSSSSSRTTTAATTSLHLVGDTNDYNYTNKETESADGTSLPDNNKNLDSSTITDDETRDENTTPTLTATAPPTPIIPINTTASAVNTTDNHVATESTKANQTTTQTVTDTISTMTSALNSSAMTTSTTTINSTVFKRYDGVVIATKLHGPHQRQLLFQSLCLLQAAYNRKVNYDIVVFYTEDLNETDMSVTEQIVAPSRIIWAKDNKGSLRQEIDALSPTRRSNFLKACGANTSDGIDWFSDCGGRVAYNWQAEFRSWHIWTHTALRPYRTMLWLDTDGFATKEWHIDPVQTMIENELNILFMNFPMGRGKGQEIHDRMFNSFNKTICSLSVKNGRLDAKYGDSADSCPGSRVPMIHGFFHITNLDFYRRPDVLKFEETWIGDGFCQRRFDDQFAVTAPAAILSPDKAWDMHANGIQLDVFHNAALDGKRKNKVGGYLKYWKTNVKDQFPEAVDKCAAYIIAGMR